MNWLKRNIRYFILSLFLLTNGLIIFEATLAGGASGARSSLLSLILSVFVNKTVDGPETAYVPIESLTLKTKDDTTLTEGMHFYIPLGITRRITATVLPENATDKGVNWTSSDSSALEVYPGGYLEARALSENVLVTAMTNSPLHRISFYVTIHEKVAPLNTKSLLLKIGLLLTLLHNLKLVLMKVSLMNMMFVNSLSLVKTKVLQLLISTVLLKGLALAKLMLVLLVTTENLR